MTGIATMTQTFAGTGVGVASPVPPYTAAAPAFAPVVGGGGPRCYLAGGGGATIKFQISRDGGASWFDLANEAGTVISLVLAAAAAICVPFYGLEVGCVLRANCSAYTGGTPVAQFSQ